MPKSSKHHGRRPRYGGAPPPPKPRAGAQSEGVRLQKVLAAAGIGSRRQCEELIREGRVDVDGQAVTELGTRVDPAVQQIRVDGEKLRRARHIYFAINKPAGILSTSQDPSGRPRVIDLAPSRERLFTVGRLDKSSEGLIVVTNDGQLTDLLTHPRYGVEKTYLAQVVGAPTPQELAHLRRGVHFAEGFAHAKRVRVRRMHKQSAILEIVLDEGRNREVRRLLARIGHKVLRLQRSAIGPLRLGNLQPGESRMLGSEEVEQLYRAAREGRKRKPAARRPEVAVAKPVGGKSEPIIDYSLPPEIAGEEEGWPTADAELAAFQIGEIATGQQAESLEDPSADVDDFAEVDLAPIGRRDAKRQHRTTVIGGDERPKSGERGAGRRHRHRGRHSRNRSSGQQNARGKGGERKGRRRSP